jgi:hypothetical protein
MALEFVSAQRKRFSPLPENVSSPTGFLLRDGKVAVENKV